MEAAGPSNRLPPGDTALCYNRLDKYRNDLRQILARGSNSDTKESVAVWKKFVDEYYSPTAKKSWCFTSYDKITGDYPLLNMDTWECEICGESPGKGFETNFEDLQYLFAIKYAPGEVKNENFLFWNFRETLSPDGNMILDFKKAFEETQYQEHEVFHEGKVVIEFAAQDLKILSWKFCCQGHEVRDSSGVPAEERQLTQLMQSRKLNELGFSPKFFRKLKALADYSATLEGSDNQELPQNENPADDQNEDVDNTDINNPADGQNDGVDNTDIDDPADDQNEDRDM